MPAWRAYTCSCRSVRSRTYCTNTCSPQRTRTSPAWRTGLELSWTCSAPSCSWRTVSPFGGSAGSPGLVRSGLVVGRRPGRSRTVASSIRTASACAARAGGAVRAQGPLHASRCACVRSRRAIAVAVAVAVTERQRAARRAARLSSKKTGGVLLSQALAGQVPSALRGLTSLFGMGRGVSPSPRPPEKVERPTRLQVLQNCTAPQRV
jgi:hypothetical protein